MARAAKVCNVAGCPAVVTTAGRCAVHQRQAQHARESGGYNTVGHRRFRSRVLARDPVCVLCRQALSTVADHYPISKRDLIARSMDANDAQHGRGLCKRCHDVATSTHQPGGWNDRG